jgi:3-hydroxyisobutyrate dehydrogenase
LAGALDQVVEAGATRAASVAEAVAGAELVFTMLPEGRHVREAYLGDGGILASLTGPTLLVDCSTIDVATAREVAARAGDAGHRMLDAPVSGGVHGAQAGSLTFMVGGSAAAFDEARPLLEAMGRNIVHAGAAGNGQAAKACNNMMAAINLIGASEGFALGEALGVERQVLYDIISTSSGGSWMLSNLCPAPGPLPDAPSSRGYRAGFKAALMAKDVRLSQSAATGAGVSTPLGALACTLYDFLCRQGHGELDCSAVFKLIARDEE